MSDPIPDTQIVDPLTRDIEILRAETSPTGQAALERVLTHLGDATTARDHIAIQAELPVDQRTQDLLAAKDRQVADLVRHQS